MFCEQNKSAQNGLAYITSDGNVDLIHEIQVKRKKKRKLGFMSHFACSSIRKLDKILWTNTSHMVCSTGANMQANTEQSQLALLGSTEETHTPTPSTPSPWGDGGTYHLLALLRRYISGEKRRKRKQGISNNTV